MKHENLWTFPPAATPPQSTESAVEIIKEQARYLDDNMDGKVRASFHTLPEDYGPDYEYRMTVNGKTRDNAEELYIYQRYAFDIYNSTYLFRMFTMRIPPFYPVEIHLDSDIQESVEILRQPDIEIQKFHIVDKDIIWIDVKSDDALKKLLKKVFSTQKVQFMLYKLRQQSEEAEKTGT